MVQEFEFVPGRFQAVQYDGTNLVEIAEFVGGDATISTVSGVLALELTNKTVLLEDGWWVRRGVDGRLRVTSDDTEWTRVGTYSAV